MEELRQEITLRPQENQQEKEKEIGKKLDQQTPGNDKEHVDRTAALEFG